MYSSCREEIVEAFDALEADLDRVASHAHHYLCIFDKGKAIALYHTKRLASPGQRIVLYAKERLGDALISCLHHPHHLPGVLTLTSVALSRLKAIRA